MGMWARLGVVWPRLHQAQGRVMGARAESSSAQVQALTIPPKLDQYMCKMRDKMEWVVNQTRPTAEMNHLRQRFDRVSPYYIQLEAMASESHELLALCDQPDFQAMAETEWGELSQNWAETLAQVQGHLLEPESFDRNNASLEVIPGAGGLEACLFAQEVFDMYTRYMSSLGFQVDITEYEKSSVGLGSKFSSTTGIQKAVALVEGQAVFKTMKYECGVHRVQRVPVTGTKNDRLQTSTCSVAVIPLLDESDVVVKEKDLKYEFTRSSGPGGQSVNKTDSACRLTYLPTGLVTECQEERLPLANKKKALVKLKKLLFEEKYQAELSQVTKARKSQIGSMNRNEKIRTYNYSRHQLIDHRIGVSKSLPNLANFFEGAFGYDILDEFRDQLEAEARANDFEELLETDP
eukprot:maker-scaffold784_size97500-snap-gene-0.26 protein:Tk02995 transcript:maker-scaffold784_size97500-snap-gene-0.26-mRNA-1 annotation:"peptide chain release factor 1"